VKTGKRVSGTLSSVKKLSDLNSIGSLKKDKMMCKMNQDVDSQSAESRYKCGQSTNLDVLRSKIRHETNSRRIEHE
jgi:hypothetical protein